MLIGFTNMSNEHVKITIRSIISFDAHIRYINEKKLKHEDKKNDIVLLVVQMKNLITQMLIFFQRLKNCSSVILFSY